MLFSFSVLGAQTLDMVVEGFKLHDRNFAERSAFIKENYPSIMGVLLTPPESEEDKGKMAYLSFYLFRVVIESRDVSPSFQELVAIMNNSGNYNFTGNFLSKQQYEDCKANGWALEGTELDFYRSSDPEKFKVMAARSHEDWDYVFNSGADIFWYPIHLYREDYVKYSLTLTLPEEKDFLYSQIEYFQMHGRDDVVDFLFSRAQLLQLRESGL